MSNSIGKPWLAKVLPGLGQDFSANRLRRVQLIDVQEVDDNTWMCLSDREFTVLAKASSEVAKDCAKSYGELSELRGGVFIVDFRVATFLPSEQNIGALDGPITFARGRAFYLDASKLTYRGSKGEPDFVFTQMNPKTGIQVQKPLVRIESDNGIMKWWDEVKTSQETNGPTAPNESVQQQTPPATVLSSTIQNDPPKALPDPATQIQAMEIQSEAQVPDGRVVTNGKAPSSKPGSLASGSVRSRTTSLRSQPRTQSTKAIVEVETKQDAMDVDATAAAMPGESSTALVESTQELVQYKPRTSQQVVPIRTSSVAVRPTSSNLDFG